MSAGLPSPAQRPDATPAPTLDQVRALAYAALLDHARRSDHAHALDTLVRGLSSLIGHECWLWPQSPASGPALLPIHARPPVRATAATDGEPVQSAWSCSHSGTVVGELRTPVPAGVAIDDWGDRLLPARDAAAALLAGLLEGAGHALPGSLALQRTAMHEAGTYVWEWNLQTDVLGDIDEGERILGYPLNTLGHTQADWDRLVHPDDRRADRQGVQRPRAAAREPMYRAVYRARAADGDWRWIEERGRIVEWDRRWPARAHVRHADRRDAAAPAGTGAARPPGRRGRQQRQDDVSLAHQPRAAHAAQRGAGLRAVAGHRPRAGRA